MAELLGVPEKVLRANKPIELFWIDDKKYETPLLSIDKADDWLDKAAEVEAAELTLSTERDPEQRGIKRRKFNRLLLDCVLSYNPDTLPREAIEGRISGAQLMDAMWRLKSLTDPFEVAQAMTQETTMRQLNMLPKSVLERLPIEQMLNRTNGPTLTG